MRGIRGWSAEDEAASEAEGWYISSVREQEPMSLQWSYEIRTWSYGEPTRPLNAMRSDADAWNHVCARADEGSNLHERALVLVVRSEMERKRE